MNQLGKYTLFEQLGQGGFGVVYKALDKSLNRELAVKLLNPLFNTDTEFINRFSEEAKLTATLEHSNIVPVYDTGQDNGFYYIAMKLMLGGSLADLIEKQKTGLPYWRAVQIMDQIAKALDYAHAKDIIHRDVKPANILFDANGSAFLSDFGLARASHGTKSASISRNIKGTYEYLAPEIWSGKEPSPATDVYSLACVFYESVTGKRLFEGTIAELVNQHIQIGPVFPTTWPDGVPAGVKTILHKALARDPQERYESTGAFVKALQGLTAPVPPFDERHPPKSEPSLRIATIVVLTMIIVGVLFFGGIFVGRNLFSTNQTASVTDTESPATSEFISPPSTIVAQNTFTLEPSPTSLPPSTTATLPPTATPPPTATSTPTPFPTISGPLTVDLAQTLALSSLADLTALTFSADGTLIAAARPNLEITVWSTDGNLLHTFTGHAIRVDSLAFSHDNSLLASGDADGVVRVIRISNSNLLASWNAHTAGVGFVGFFIDRSIVAGEILITGGGPFDPEVRRWNPMNGNEIDDPFSGPAGPVRSLDFATERKLLAGISTNTSSVYVWKSAGQSVAYRVTAEGNAQPRSVRFSPDESLLATGWNDGQVRLWDAADGDWLVSFEAASEIVALAFSPDGKWLAVGTLNGKIFLWDVEHDTLLADWKAHDGQIFSLLFTNNHTLLTGSQDGQVKIWELTSP